MVFAIILGAVVGLTTGTDYAAYLTPLGKIFVNMLKMVKLLLPGMDSYKLENIERYFGIRRSTRKYKTSVFTIWKHWEDPVKRQHVIRYNLEDARNLRQVYYILLADYGLRPMHLEQCRLL